MGSSPIHVTETIAFCDLENKRVANTAYTVVKNLGAVVFKRLKH